MAVVSLIFFGYIVLFTCCLSVDIWFAPNKTYLQTPMTKLQCHARVETFPFLHDFVFYKNGEKLQDEGGAPHVVSTEEPVVYYELSVENPAIYVCQVDGKNATAEVFKPPDDPVFIVEEVYDDAKILCPEGLPGSRNTLHITPAKELDAKRVEMKSKNYAIIHNVRYQDVFGSMFCVYTLPSDNAVATSKIQLILVRKEVEKLYSKSTRKVTCSAYSNATGIELVLTASGADPAYSVVDNNTVSEEYDKNITNISCSVLYKGKTIWSDMISIKEKGSGDGHERGIPKVLIGMCCLSLIIILVVTMIFLHRCRLRTRLSEQVLHVTMVVEETETSGTPFLGHEVKRKEGEQMVSKSEEKSNAVPDVMPTPNTKILNVADKAERTDGKQHSIQMSSEQKKFQRPLIHQRL